MNPYRCLGRAALAVLFAVAGSAGAQTAPSTPLEPRWMQIEVVAFRHVPADDNGEKWPATPALSYPAPLRFLLEPGSPAFNAAMEAREFERALQAESGSAAPAAPTSPAATPAVPEIDALPGVLLQGPETVLADAAARIAGASGYRLLAHLAWREPRLADGSTEHVLVTGGTAAGEQRELEGSISITQSRFLHIETALWLNDFPAPGEPPGADAVALPPIPQPVLPQPAPQATAEATFVPDDAALAAPEAPPVVIEPVRAKRTVLLSASRRIAPGEVHYIDHPLLGLLVTVRPWDPAIAASPADAPAIAPQQGAPAAPATPAPATQPGG